MQAADRFIEEIVSSSQIPSGRRRREVLRELKTHVDDFVHVSLAAGRSEEETQRLVVASFGDPREIAKQFAWVYRRERTILRIFVFLVATVAMATSIAAMVMTLKAGIAIGSGVPLIRMFSARHTMIETINILSSAAAYLGLISLEHIFEHRRFAKAAACLSLLFAIVMAAFSLSGAPWGFLLFGLVCAVFLRTVQVFLKNQAARIGVVVACFGLIGLITFRPLYVASWLVTGLGYQTMTYLAARVDRALFNGLQQL
jgi:hypothetical protein